jgi:hypothetical protein
MKEVVSVFISRFGSRMPGPAKGLFRNDNLLDLLLHEEGRPFQETFVIRFYFCHVKADKSTPLSLDHNLPAPPLNMLK